MKDLVKLYSIYSVSYTKGEAEICEWLCDRLTELKVDFKRVGNSLYHFTRDNDVLLSAHLDQVETNGRAAHIYKDESGKIFAFNDKWQRTSLGADDKNGVWIILKLLETGHKFDFVISEGEEVGGIGITEVAKNMFETAAKFCLVLDRKGNTDILNKGAGTPFCEALAYNLKNFLKNGYEVNTGSISDAHTICKFMETVNMSVAYFEPHTAKETTDFNRLQVIKDDVARVISEGFVHYPASPSAYAEKYNNHWWKDRGY